jgi:hypothetical protein
VRGDGFLPRDAGPALNQCGVASCVTTHRVPDIVPLSVAANQVAVSAEMIPMSTPSPRVAVSEAHPVLSDERWIELSDVAHRNGVHRSEIISEAISLYLDNLKNYLGHEKRSVKQQYRPLSGAPRRSHDFDREDID